MKPIEWYDGKCSDDQYKELFGDQWLGDYPKRPDYEYIVIKIDGCSENQTIDYDTAKTMFSDDIMNKTFLHHTANVDQNTVLIKRKSPLKLQQYKTLSSLFQQQRNRLLEIFKQDLCDENLKWHQLSDICYRMAWDRGHSSGLQEVASIYEDVASDLEKCFELGRQSVIVGGS